MQPVLHATGPTCNRRSSTVAEVHSNTQWPYRHIHILGPNSHNVKSVHPGLYIIIHDVSALYIDAHISWMTKLVEWFS